MLEGKNKIMKKKKNNKPSFYAQRYEHERHEWLYTNIVCIMYMCICMLKRKWINKYYEIKRK